MIDISPDNKMAHAGIEKAAIEELAIRLYKAENAGADVEVIGPTGWGISRTGPGWLGEHEQHREYWRNMARVAMGFFDEIGN